MAANVPLIERADIHKSCKALEGIVNAFNDYCQAAEALALVQKKLARALKDAVGLKATNELVGNALNAAAILLDSLAEVDAKFVKVIDKECEGTSNDLKKWFKKLAKEEKNHDEKISAANAKIKQAGLAYEKKAKKKDAGEEHTRYVNLLSVVGPEVSQERYSHTLSVTQRHTATLYNVASSISRAADAEWTRACDSVRKFAPVIGRIGECRAYLEGGWQLNMPDASEDPDEKDGVDANIASRNQDAANGVVDEMGVRVGKSASGSTDAEASTHAHHAPAPAYAFPTGYGPASSPAPAPSHPTSQGPPSVPSSLPSRSHTTGPPPTSYAPTQFERLNTDSVRSIDSLSNFPVPPTHFPLPPMTQTTSSPLARSTEENKRSFDNQREKASSDKSSEAQRLSNKPRQQKTPESPSELAIPLDHTTPALTDDNGRSQTSGPSHPATPVTSPGASRETSNRDDTPKAKPTVRPESPQQQRRDIVPLGANEVGVQERKVSEGIERSESVLSTNSIVASMRDKWGRGDVASPPPPRERDIPKVPNKVSDLASRYVPSTDTTTPLSPRNTGGISPTSDRSRQVSGQSTKDEISGSSSTQSSQSTAAVTTDPGVTPSELNIIRRRRRIEELEELERREQAQLLRAREREIEMQTKELERERDRLRALGIVSSSISGAATVATATAVRGHPQHSYSMVNLVPSYSGVGEIPARPVSQLGEPLAMSVSPSTSSTSNSNPSARPDHAPYCGCQSCSASQYSNPHPHAQIAAQPRAGQKEKPKGWIRRLSMPVVASAFSSTDSKKPYGIGAGVAGGPQANTTGALAYFEQDSTGGITNVRPRKISFGRR